MGSKMIWSLMQRLETMIKAFILKSFSCMLMIWRTMCKQIKVSKAMLIILFGCWMIFLRPVSFYLSNFINLMFSNLFIITYMYFYFNITEKKHFNTMVLQLGNSSSSSNCCFHLHIWLGCTHHFQIIDFKLSSTLYADYD
jgi:hypothetical protein